MIIDKLENIGKYAGIHPNMALTADFAQKCIFSSLPMGKQILAEKDGVQNVYFTVHENTLHHSPVWEAHEKYADIQLILSGCEAFGFGTQCTFSPIIPERDICECECTSSIDFKLHAGEFVMFLPGEAHAPGLYGGESSTCKKVVFKVLMK